MHNPMRKLINCILFSPECDDAVHVLSKADLEHQIIEFKPQNNCVFPNRLCTPPPAYCESDCADSAIPLEERCILNAANPGSSMGPLTNMRKLVLEGPSSWSFTSFGHLTSLLTLTLSNSPLIKELPTCLGQLTTLRTLILRNLVGLTELPTCTQLLTNLRELAIESCGIEELTAIGAFTKLTTLRIMYCTALKNLPPSIELLTALHTITLYLPGKYRVGPPGVPRVHNSSVLKTLASALPALRLLQHLDLSGIQDADVLAVGRSLKAWPQPLLLDFGHRGLRLQKFVQSLSLPAEAGQWSDVMIVQHFSEEQHKIEVFASGLHVRLGTASVANSLNQMTLVLIANEVLGSWSLLEAWASV